MVPFCITFLFSPFSSSFFLFWLIFYFLFLKKCRSFFLLFLRSFSFTVFLSLAFLPSLIIIIILLLSLLFPSSSYNANVSPYSLDYILYPPPDKIYLFYHSYSLYLHYLSVYLNIFAPTLFTFSFCILSATHSATLMIFCLSFS